MRKSRKDKWETVYELYDREPISALKVQSLVIGGACILRQDSPNHLVYYYPKGRKKARS